MYTGAILIICITQSLYNSLYVIVKYTFNDVFPPDDLGSRPEALCKYIYVYICMYIPYTSSVIGRLYNGIVIQDAFVPGLSLRISDSTRC